MQEVKDTVADDSGGGGQSLAHSRSLRAAATMERILATLAAEDAAAEESAAGAAWQPIDGEADSDSWLQLTEAEVDAMLRGFGQQPAPGSPSPAPGGAASAAGAATERQPTPVEAEELLGLTQKMTAFLAQASGLEGVSDPATAEQRQETGKDESSAAATLAQHEAALAERRRHMEQLEEQERTGQGAAAAAEPSPLLGHQPVAWPSRTKARATAAAAAAAARQKAPEQAGHVEPDASEPESEPEPGSGGAAEAFSAAWLRASPWAGRFHLGIGSYWLRFTYVTPVLVNKYWGRKRPGREEQAAHLAVIGGSGQAEDMEEELLNAQRALVEAEAAAQREEAAAAREAALEHGPVSQNG
jgi:hypothetical protein